jgi:hypothetical protein
MRLLPVLALTLATGCASTLSTMQTARPLPQGQWQLSYGVGAFVPAGQIITVVDTGIDEGKRARDAHEDGVPYQMSSESKDRLFAAGVALAVAPPGVNNELMLRAGVAPELEVGLRYSGISLRLDAKYRLQHWGAPDTTVDGVSYDLALGVGVARHLFKSQVLDALEVMEVEDFSRFDVEVPIYVSAEWGEIFKLYWAPKYVYSRTSLDQKLVDYAAEASGATGTDVTLPSRVSSHFMGATLGGAIGYKYVHLYAELTGGYTLLKPQIFGAERDLGGVTLYPTVGIAIRPFAGQGRGARRR